MPVGTIPTSSNCWASNQRKFRCVCPALIGHPLLTQGLILAFRNQIVIFIRDGGNFEEMHLLSSFSDELNAHFKKWLDDNQIIIHKAAFARPDAPSTEIASDRNFKSVYDVSKKLLEKVRRKDRELCIFL